MRQERTIWQSDCWRGHLSPQEQAIVQRSLNALQTHYAADVPDAKQLIAMGDSKADLAIPAEKLAAWTMLANQLMNLDEVLNK